MWDDVRVEGGVCKTFIRQDLIIVFPQCAAPLISLKKQLLICFGLTFLILFKSRLFIPKLLYKPRNCVFGDSEINLILHL